MTAWRGYAEVLDSSLWVALAGTSSTAMGKWLNREESRVCSAELKVKLAAGGAGQ